MPAAMRSNVAARDELNGELLLMPLSYLALLVFNSLAVNDKEDIVVARDEGYSGSDTGSRESLFGDAAPAKEKLPHVPAWKKLVTGWRGFSQLEIADNYSSPEHFSKAKLRTELSRTGQFNEHIKWKISGRFDYDAAYDLSNFYPPAVRRDQR